MTVTALEQPDHRPSSISPAYDTPFALNPPSSLIENTFASLAAGAASIHIPSPSMPSYNIDPILLDYPTNHSPLTDYQLPGAVVNNMLALQSPLPQMTTKPMRKRPTPKRKGTKNGEAENIGTPPCTLTAAQKQAAM